MGMEACFRQGRRQVTRHGVSRVLFYVSIASKVNTDNLIHSYTHGGGLQFSAAPNNDFSDWVSQDEGFIAVNMGYR